VRLFTSRRKLRLKESGQEKTFIREIESAHFVVRAVRGDAQPGGPYLQGRVFACRARRLEKTRTSTVIYS